MWDMPSESKLKGGKSDFPPWEGDPPAKAEVDDAGWSELIEDDLSEADDDAGRRAEEQAGSDEFDDDSELTEEDQPEEAAEPISYDQPAKAMEPVEIDDSVEDSGQTENDEPGDFEPEDNEPEEEQNDLTEEAAGPIEPPAEPLAGGGPIELDSLSVDPALESRLRAYVKAKNKWRREIDRSSKMIDPDSRRDGVRERIGQMRPCIKCGEMILACGSICNHCGHQKKSGFVRPLAWAVFLSLVIWAGAAWAPDLLKADFSRFFKSSPPQATRSEQAKPAAGKTGRSKKALTTRAEVTVPAETTTNEWGMKFVLIKAGPFSMGQADSRPGQPIRIEKDFYIQTTEVTRRQWMDVASGRSADERLSALERDIPKTQVSWHDAMKLIKRMNEKDRKYRYRLPTGSRPSRWCTSIVAHR